MITGHIDCPRCGDIIEYTAEIEIGPVVERTDNAVSIEVNPTNITHNHHCKTPAAA